MHRGQMLKRVVKTKKVRVKELVKKLKISRGTYYNDIKKPDLSFEKLQMYGLKIHHDFSNEIPGMVNYIIEDPAEKYSPPPATLVEAIEEIEKLRDKCREQSEKIELMQKYIRVLEQAEKGQ